jgi:hypothetical protein
LKIGTVISIPIVAASLAANAYFVWAGRVLPTCQVASEQPEVIRVKGGLLEVTNIRATERFERTTDDTILGIPVGKVVTKIRVPVTYRYHVKLADNWSVLLKDKTFIVISPPAMPSLPVAFDAERLEAEANGRWVVFTGSAHIRELERSITKSLAEMAARPSYVNFQREAARETVKEFVAKWLQTQERWKSGTAYPIKVFFADEAIQSMSTVPQPFAGSL